MTAKIKWTPGEGHIWCTPSDKHVQVGSTGGIDVLMDSDEARAFAADLVRAADTVDELEAEQLKLEASQERK